MANHSTPLWEIEDLTKDFPGVRALDRVSLEILPSEVHALVGENGSGKSTLIKCLSGVHAPTSGRILYRGTQVSLSDPSKARRYGVATIFQELSLFPQLTVAENIFVGQMPKKSGFVDWAAMRNRSEEIFEELKLRINPTTLVASLSIADQQLVEIAKALSKKSELLIMDEPTAALDVNEIRVLHTLTRRLAEKGCAIIYISHRMDEIEDVADCISVLKDGRLAKQERAKDITISEVIKAMIGAEIKEHYPKQDNRTDASLLNTVDLRTENKVNGVSFDIRRGEVFGLAGVGGSGRTELARAIFGVDMIIGGTIKLSTESVRNTTKYFASPREAIRSGVSMITESRKENGLFANFDAAKNITIANLNGIKQYHFLNLRREVHAAKEFVTKLNMPESSIGRSVQFLSGGNQQKVILSRWIYSKAELFIMDEPTQGIDVGAKVEVYRLMNELTASGKGILLISSDFEELLYMSDRIGVLVDGKLEATLNARELSRQQLTEIVLSSKSHDLPGSREDAKQ
jgi:ribose transport system ATP-binding protein